MKGLEISHDILIAGPDFESCRQKVEHFFDRTMLIRYDRVLIPESDSVNAGTEEFWPRLQQGLAANQQVLREFLGNLEEEGFRTVADLESLEKGYLSKTLHTVAHLQDGLIGIDSRLYNFEEDSHSVSRGLQQKIAAAPGDYWILRVMGRISAPGEDPLDRLRTFEWKGKQP